MGLPRSKPAKPSTTFLSLPLELRQKILLQSYKRKRPELHIDYTTSSLLLQSGPSVRDVRAARSFYTHDKRCRRQDQGQERDLAYHRMNVWADRLIKVHQSLGEDLVFVQKMWREDFEKEIKENSRWRKELGEKLKEKERELGLRDRR
ncbi:hypothetical protein E6O75_ATG03741 [Venturia nashicola]|uniref:Uncharacterized protein n=1 Tax=Venturia nashicola TaxID=86259 RepID=A0A4Z1PBY5_9PEZI|nr:hypothetical protein E6O75_ATG03741 [Venturia nashicola]